MKYSYSYIIHLQFLGFRFHGWQKQLTDKTLHYMVDKSLSFVLNTGFKSHGIGRTDAKVSAQEYQLQVFTEAPIGPQFLKDLQSNLPPDIKVLEVASVDLDFNLIQHPKLKTYGYFFSFGTKNHPYAAPFIHGVLEPLDLAIMQAGALLFQGEHWFHKYCTKPSANTQFCREIIQCNIQENTQLTASFFPEKSYVLTVKGEGFLRYQIRLMMGVLFELGRGNCDMTFIRQSLREDNDRLPLRQIAPGSGLHLLSTQLK